MGKMFSVFLMASKTGRYEVRSMFLLNPVPDDVLRLAKADPMKGSDLTGPEAAKVAEACNAWYDSQNPNRKRI